MSEMSAALRKATNKVVKLAQDEDMVIVGFAVPRSLEGGDFGWSLFANCNEREANELLQTIADVLKDVQDQDRSSSSSRHRSSVENVWQRSIKVMTKTPSGNLKTIPMRKLLASLKSDIRQVIQNADGFVQDSDKPARKPRKRKK